MPNNNNIRYRVSLPPLSVNQWYRVNGGAIEGLSSVNYWTHFDRISDRINPIKYGTIGKRPPGPCWHETVHVSGLLPNTTFTANDGSQVIMGQHAAARLSGMWPDTSPRNAIWFNGWLNLLSSLESSAAYRNICVEAFNKQITQVPPKTSLINFLLELTELKPIFKSLLSIPKHLVQNTLSKQVTGKRLSRRTPYNLAKGSAKAFLAVEFQWLPFVSDIMAFITSVDRMTKRLNYLRKTKGKETTVRFVKQDAFERPELGTDILVYDDGGEVRQYLVLKRYQADFISTWKLYQDLQGLDDAWAGLRGVFADLGVNNPLQIVWNAIPFSFLVDWVAPFSSWLTQAAVQPFYGEWRVYDVTSSIKEVYTIDNRFTAKLGGTNGTEFSVDIESYRRLPYLPLTMGEVDFTHLTDTQLKLAASLVLVQGPR